MPDDTIASHDSAADFAAPSPALGSGADGDSSAPTTLEQVLESADITKMSDAEVADFESGDPDRVHSALAKQLTPNARNDEGPSRFSLKALKPEDRTRTVQALDLIRAGQSPADAFAQVFGISALPQAMAAAVSEPEAGTAAAEEVPGIYPQVAELENHLSYLQQQYQQAKESYDPSATDILEQMQDVKLDLREARREEAAATHAWEGGQSESHARAMESFGGLIADERSGFLPLCDDEILLAEAKNDQILNQPDWPERIGQRVMDKFFSGGAAHSPYAAGGLSRVPPVPRHSVRLPGSPVGPGFSAGSLSPETAMAEIDKLTPEQQDAFIQSLDHLTSRHSRR
ncbi:hypothetical protein [Prosthecobacter sp.]|uniref:hypothetical protein n=1 Tax=Prosthecobacter sp. TaxID=1965333 RepID=UPI0037841D13